MKIYHLGWLLLLYLLPHIAAAQDSTQPLNLKQCIDYGLKNHRSNRIAENNLANAAQQKREARAAYLPSVTGTGVVTDNLKPQVTIIPAGVFSPTDIKVALTKKYNPNGYIDFSQPIYDGAALASLKAAQYNTEEARLNQRQTEEDLIYNISSAYYQVFVYRVQLALLQSNKSTYTEQVRISDLQVKKGVTAEVDLNKIQVNLNNTNSNINLAESNLKLSQAQLKNAMGYPQEQTLSLDTVLSDADNTAAVLQAIGDSSFKADNLTGVRLSQNDLALLDIDARRTRAGALPSLSLSARYGTIGFGDNVGESFKSLASYSTISLNLKVPLFDGFKRNAQYQQARIKQQNAEESLRLDIDKYRVDYENAKTQLQKAEVNVVNDRRNIELAQSVFKSTDLQYQKGVTELVEWLNALSSLRESQNNFLNSLYTFYQSRIDLEKAAGTLKTYYSSL